MGSWIWDEIYWDGAMETYWAGDTGTYWERWRFLGWGNGNRLGWGDGDSWDREMETYWGKGWGRSEEARDFEALNPAKPLFQSFPCYSSLA